MALLPSLRRARAKPHAVVAAAALVLALPFVVGWKPGVWHDYHINYPHRPHGYRQIVRTFGKPCSRAAGWNRMAWRAADNGVTYHPRFHRKLGGVGTQEVRARRGRSTNLDNDIYGHIRTRGLGRFVKSGIWGYACRYIAGTTSWSTHAWGIAIDISAAFEPCCDNHRSRVNFHTAAIWRHHGWEWGKVFGDPMHFQYATGY
jgi:D-alanyl-D-alanine carboxypeptidase